MKKISFLLVFVVLTAFTAVSSNGSGKPVDMSKFEITPVTDLNLGKNAEKVWTISYDSGNSLVTVVKHTSSSGNMYAVHSDFFDVCFVSSEKGFGARKLRNSLCNARPEFNKAVINENELARQKVITPHPVDDETAVSLIASYLPMLLNPAYQHLMN